jgi:hypothetical protein
MQTFQWAEASNKVFSTYYVTNAAAKGNLMHMLCGLASAKFELAYALGSYRFLPKCPARASKMWKPFGWNRLQYSYNYVHNPVQLECHGRGLSMMS